MSADPLSADPPVMFPISLTMSAHMLHRRSFALARVAAQDKSWRVRYNVAQQLTSLCEALGPELSRCARLLLNAQACRRHCSCFSSTGCMAEGQSPDEGVWL